MKYYIPLHRDNIDNVISAESLSPADYYPLRSFGYHYFKQLDEVPINRELFFFTRIPIIPVIGESAEDAVLFIEFDDDKQLKKFSRHPFNNGIRVGCTINLYPWNCRFIFQTEEALHQAVVMCKMSQNNKMWTYYDFSLLNTKPTPYKTDTLKKAKPASDCNIQEVLKQEERQNRLKGFLYAYILGRYVSLSQPLASLLKMEKEMYDLASTLSGLQGFQSEELLRQLEELERRYVKYDPKREELHRKWRQMIEERFEDNESQHAFESIVQELGCESLMKTNFAKKLGIGYRPQYEMPILRYADWKQYKKELEDYTQNHLQSYRSRKGDTNTKGDFTIDGFLIKMASKNGFFYGDLITQIIEGIEWITLEKIRLNRLDVASDMTRLVRDVMLAYGQNWEQSAERAFMNGLRQHIATGGTFDVLSAPSVILKGIATFILKGDDFEEMMRFMEYTAQNDYRFVLGLWGACKGYADIPKTAMMRMNLNPKGEDDIYLATCRLLVDLPTDVRLERHQYQFTSRKAESLALSQTLVEVLKDKSLGLTKSQRDSILNIWRELNGKTDKEFYDSVSKIKGIGKKKLQKLKELIGTGTIATEKQPSLFEEEQAMQYRRFDLSAWKYIEPLLPDDSKVRDVLKDDFEWFVNKNKQNKDFHRQIADYGTHLYVKAHPKKGKSAWTAEYFSNVDIEKITKELLRVYDIKC